MCAFVLSDVQIYKKKCQNRFSPVSPDALCNTKCSGFRHFGLHNGRTMLQHALLPYDCNNEKPIKKGAVFQRLLTADMKNMQVQ